MKSYKLLVIGIFTLIPTITFSQTAETQITFNSNISTTTCSITSSHSSFDLKDFSLEEITKSNNLYDDSQKRGLIITLTDCDNQFTISIPELSSGNGVLLNNLAGNLATTGLALEVLIQDRDTNRTYWYDSSLRRVELPEKQKIGPRIIEVAVNYTNIKDTPITVGKFKTVATFVFDYK